MTKHPIPVPAPEAPEEAHSAFSVDASLLFQLGEELVNRRSVALAELIKNAYDADARLVSVRLNRVTQPGGVIEVIDDGTGLSYAALKRSWFRIATPTKVHEPESPSLHRARAGAKGVGRFAARRIGQRLVVESIARSEDRPNTFERIYAFFDWDQFKPGLLVEQILIPVKREFLPATPRPQTGLTLRLEGVRDTWQFEDVRDLQSDLFRLLSPSTGNDEDTFRITLESSEFPSLSGDLKEKFLEYGLARLDGVLTKDGKPSYVLKFRDAEAEPFYPAEAKFPTVGGVRFQITFFVYKSNSFSGLPIKTREAQQRGREQGGVMIYVDRFRVPPYGDPGDDWLNLDEHRGRRLDKIPEALTAESGHLEGRPMLFLPGNNQLFGAVHLTRAGNSGLRQTVNRERFIENAAFQELRAFVRLGIDWMTVRYAARVAAERKATPAADPEAILSKARNKFLEALDTAAIGDDDRTEVIQSFDLAMHAVRARQEELISELSMLRVLASTGTMIAVFEHQLMASLSALHQHATRVQQIGSRLPSAQKRAFQAESRSLDGWIRDLQLQASLIGLLVARESRTRRKRVTVRPKMEAVAASFAAFMRDNGIEFSNEVGATLKTPAMYPAELTAVLLNLFTNALKAVRHCSARKIRASGARSHGSIYILLSDSGVGAPRSGWEAFFEPFNTTSQPDPLLGHGTGLGLKIVRDIAELYRGKAQFIEPEPPWKTTIQISLPEGS